MNNKWFPSSPKFPKKYGHTLQDPNSSFGLNQDDDNKKKSSAPAQVTKIDVDNIKNDTFLFPLKRNHRQSFTPLVNISDLLNSVNGSTYFNYKDDLNAVNFKDQQISPAGSSESSGSSGSMANSLRKIAATLSIPLPTSSIADFTNSALPLGTRSKYLQPNIKNTQESQKSEPTSPTTYSKNLHFSSQGFGQNVQQTTTPKRNLIPSQDFESPSERVLNDFNAILSSGDVQQMKSYLRNNNWPIDQPVRSVIWLKLCSKVGGGNRSVLPYDDYEELVKEYYPAALDKDKSESLISEEDCYVMPNFVDTKFMSHYHLNSQGQNSLKRIVSILEYTHPDISYGPQIYYLAAIFLHFLSESQTFECLCHLLSARSESFVFKTRIGYMASGMVLTELAKKHASSSYDYLADKVKKCLDNGIGLVEPIIVPSDKRASISKDDKDFRSIMEGVFAHWLHWIFRDLPFEYIVKIMDCFLLQGTKVLYRVALALLILFKKEGKRYSHFLTPPEPGKPEAKRNTSPAVTPRLLSSGQTNPTITQISPLNLRLPVTSPSCRRSDELTTPTTPVAVNASNFPSSASTATLTQDHLTGADEGLRDPRASVVRFAEPDGKFKENFYDPDKKVHSQRHSRHMRHSKILDSPPSVSVTSSNGNNLKGSPVGKYPRFVIEDGGGFFKVASTGKSDDDELSSVRSSFTNNTSNWTAIMGSSKPTRVSFEDNVFDDDQMSTTTVSHIGRKSRDSSIDSGNVPARFNRNRRSTMSPLVGYYEYPNIGLFFTRYCQDADFSPLKLLRLAFGIRGLRSHTIDELTDKYEEFAKERVSNLFLAVAEFEDKSSSNDDTVSRTSINIPPPPSCAGSQILEREHFRYVWNWIPFRYTMYVPQLLFSTLTDGISLKTFFNRVDGEEPTLFLVKTTENDIFGAYLSTDWKGRVKNQGFFGTGESFVFTVAPEIKKYEWIGIQQPQQSPASRQDEIATSSSAGTTVKLQGTNMFQSAANNDSIIIGGGSTGNAIRFFNSLEKGYTQTCETFNSPPLIGNQQRQQFEVAILEVIGFS